MDLLLLLLVAAACALGVIAVAIVRAVSIRLGAHDTRGVEGQVKMESRRVPNTGGVAIFATLVTLIGTPLLAVALLDDQTLADGFGTSIAEHIPGARDRIPDACVLLGALALLHTMGLIDDRRPMRALPKLAIMLAAALTVVWGTDTRLLELLDTHAGGAWAGILVTVLWFVVITNAFNFLDNMDGLSAGVGAICGSVLLALAFWGGQWFVAATLATLVGSLLGFLAFNFPLLGRRPASIFMGDGGSLIVGFLLAFASVRLTYYIDPELSASARGVLPDASARWHALFVPLVAMTIPLYDFCSVTLIRLSQGKSPMVGDLQHFSHRLVKRGMSKRTAVLVIWGLTGITGIGALCLPRVDEQLAILIGVQTALVVLVLALSEYASS